MEDKTSNTFHEFLVVKCNTCDHHIGKSRHTKSVNCTRCGDIICESSPIVASAADAGDLQSLVAYHSEKVISISGKADNSKAKEILELGHKKNIKINIKSNKLIAYCK